MKEQKRWEAHYTQLDGTKRTVSFTNYEDAKRFKTVHLSHGNLLEVTIFKVVSTCEEIKQMLKREVDIPLFLVYTSICNRNSNGGFKR